MPANTTAQLIVPRLSLASCIRAIVVRSTLGCELPAEQRLNRFPASAFPSLFLQLSGESLMLEPVPDDLVCQAGMALLGGARTQPCVTGNPGPAHFMTVLFFPDALHRLTGLDMTSALDAFLPLEQLLDADWQALAARMFAAPDDAARVTLLEQFLEPRWRAVRERSVMGETRVGDWVNRLGAQAAAAGLGRSVRMAERRIREWAGQPLRKLRRIHRAERGFVAAREAALAGKLALSDLALSAGYSDQAHMCREAREISGLSPTELLRRGMEDETYWIYRIWN